MKKKFFLSVLIFLSSSLCSVYSNDLILIKKFNINGKEETKKVKILKKEEYTYSGKIKRRSDKGKVKNIYIYDENELLVKLWTAAWDNHYDLLSFEYNLEENITERNVAGAYHETQYFYDQQNRLIKEQEFLKKDSLMKLTETNYSYDEKGRVIKKESETGSTEYEYNDKDQIVHMIISDKWAFFYEYDEQGREVYVKETDGKKQLYEYFYKYDDEKNTREYRRTKKYDGEVVYDFTDYNEYDSEIRLVHSINHFRIITTQSELLNSEVKEIFYEYNDKDCIVHEKIIVGDQETNIYYEYSYWDNGNLNTVTSYEEV